MALLGPTRRTNWLPVTQEEGQQVFSSSKSDSEEESSDCDVELASLAGQDFGNLAEQPRG